MLVLATARPEPSLLRASLPHHPHGHMAPWLLSFCRLPWSQLLGLVAAVAQDGFNVTHDLGEHMPGSQAGTQHKGAHCEGGFLQGLGQVRWICMGNHSTLELGMGGGGSEAKQGSARVG